MVEVLVAEGWGNKVSILAAVRDWISELLYGENRPIKLRSDQKNDYDLTCLQIIRNLRKQIQDSVPSGGEDHAYNVTETTPNGGRFPSKDLSGA